MPREGDIRIQLADPGPPASRPRNPDTGQEEPTFVMREAWAVRMDASAGVVDDRERVYGQWRTTFKIRQLPSYAGLSEYWADWKVIDNLGREYAIDSVQEAPPPEMPRMFWLLNCSTAGNTP